jgi:hypothetical protein
VHFLTNLFQIGICNISCEQGPQKRRFSHLQEKICEKIDAASQADSNGQLKRFMRKTDAFVSLSPGNEAVKKARNTLEKFCERNAPLVYRMSGPHKPIFGDAEKSFKRKNYLLF